MLPMTDYTKLIERLGERYGVPDLSTDHLQRRRDRKRRNQRIAAGVVGIAVFVAAVWIVTGVGSLDRSKTSVLPRHPRTVPTALDVDYMIDLDSGAMTPLPEPIIRSLGPTVTLKPRSPGSAEYDISPDGSRLAYVAPGDEGTPQIFIADIDGAKVRPVTHGPERAFGPTWSPDGTMIAYWLSGGGDVGHLIEDIFIADVASGQSRHLTHGAEPQFTSDGSSLLYTVGYSWPELRTIPVGGGRSAPPFRLNSEPADDEPADAGLGSLSPDGSLVTFVGGLGSGYGPVQWLANADGTTPREMAGYTSSASEVWSPDGTRIVCASGDGNDWFITVVDVSTLEVTRVARGGGAIWLDDHTLLVEVLRRHWAG